MSALRVRSDRVGFLSELRVCATQPGNGNPLKHGLRTRAHMERLKAFRQLIGEAEELLAVVHGG